MLGRRWSTVDTNCRLKTFVYDCDFIQKKKLLLKKVSSVPATRQDVSNLQEMLDTRLQQTQARETGICPVRRELYRQCYGILCYLICLAILCSLLLIQGMVETQRFE